MTEFFRFRVADVAHRFGDRFRASSQRLLARERIEISRQLRLRGRGEFQANLEAPPDRPVGRLRMLRRGGDDRVAGEIVDLREVITRLVSPVSFTSPRSLPTAYVEEQDAWSRSGAVEHPPQPTRRGSYR